HATRVRHGQPGVPRPGQLRGRRHVGRVRPGAAEHGAVHVRLDRCAVHHRPRPGGVLPRQFPAVRAAARDVPDPVAAAVDRLGLHVVVDAEQRERDRELGAGVVRDRPDQLADLPGLGADLRHHRQHLARYPVQPGDPLRGAAEHQQGPLRGGRAGRRDRLAAVLADHVPAAAARIGRDAAPRVDLHAQGRRRHLDHDHRRPGQLVDHGGDLVVPRGLRHRPAGVLARRHGRQPAHRHRAGLRVRSSVPPATAGADMTARRTWWKTALGILFTALMLFPVYWTFNVSLTKTSDMRADPPHWFPWDPTAEGFTDVFAQQLPALSTSLGIGLGCVALTLAIAAPAGFAIAKLRPWGAGPLNFTLLVAQMIPSVVMAMGFYAIYVRLGWLNTVWGLIIADSTIAVPFGVLLFTAFMSGIPQELMHAAKIDGAG